MIFCSFTAAQQTLHGSSFCQIPLIFIQPLSNQTHAESLLHVSGVEGLKHSVNILTAGVIPNIFRMEQFVDLYASCGTASALSSIKCFTTWYAAVGENVVEKLHFPENALVLIVWEQILLDIYYFIKHFLSTAEFFFNFRIFTICNRHCNHTVIVLTAIRFTNVRLEICNQSSENTSMFDESPYPKVNVFHLILCLMPPPPFGALSNFFFVFFNRGQ